MLVVCRLWVVALVVVSGVVLVVTLVVVCIICVTGSLRMTIVIVSINIIIIVIILMSMISIVSSPVCVNTCLCVVCVCIFFYFLIFLIWDANCRNVLEGAMILLSNQQRPCFVFWSYTGKNATVRMTEEDSKTRLHEIVKLLLRKTYVRKFKMLLKIIFGLKSFHFLFVSPFIGVTSLVWVKISVFRDEMRNSAIF